MERMLRKKKDNSDYEIDRELTGKFAIEKNAEYQEKIEQLEEENKKLKEELGEYKKMFEDQLKEVYIKNTAEFLDKKFPKINGFMEEDTLQELKDIGEI